MSGGRYEMRISRARLRMLRSTQARSDMKGAEPSRGVSVSSSGVRSFRPTRRRALRMLAGAAGMSVIDAMAQAKPSLLARPIPRTAERLPAVGVGTYQTFDVGKGAPERAEL